MKTLKILKGLSILITGFVFPIHAIVEPDETKYKCTFKGVKHLNTNTVESWQNIKNDFVEWVNA